MKYRCPICNKSFTIKQKNGQSKLPRHFPFCCERCRLIDLGQWFEESYKVITRIQSEQNED